VHERLTALFFIRIWKLQFFQQSSLNVRLMDINPHSIRITKQQTGKSMPRIIEHWMHAHRLSRAVFVAITVGGVLIWALWNRPPVMIARTSQLGTVVSIVNETVTVIELSGGKEVRALTPSPAPKKGDKIPLIVETYEDGSVRAVIDLDAWHTGLPR
jgi:hypothetical protein